MISREGNIQQRNTNPQYLKTFTGVQGIPGIFANNTPQAYGFDLFKSKGCLFEPQSDTAQATQQATMQADEHEQKLLAFCQTPKTREQIQQHLGLKNRDHFRKSILNPLLEAGKLALTIPDKPTSPKQRFYAVKLTNVDTQGGKSHD